MNFEHLSKKIELCSLHQKNNAMVDILTRNTRAQQIKFYFVSDFSWLLPSSPLPKCETVEEIEFDGCSNFTEDAALRLVNLYPRVSTLSITQDVNVEIIRIFVQWPFLKSIHLKNEWSELEDCRTDNDDELLILIAENCKNLEKLYMNWFRLTDKSFLRFTELRGPQLKILIINCDNLTSVSYQSLKCCQSMEFLELRGNLAMNFDDKMVIKGLKADVWLQYWTRIDCEDSSDFSDCSD